MVVLRLFVCEFYCSASDQVTVLALRQREIDLLCTRAVFSLAVLSRGINTGSSGWALRESQRSEPADGGLTLRRRAGWNPALTYGDQAGLCSDLNVARTSDTKSAGCSQAAKWPPLG